MCSHQILLSALPVALVPGTSAAPRPQRACKRCHSGGGSLDALPRAKLDQLVGSPARTLFLLAARPCDIFSTWASMQTAVIQPKDVMRLTQRQYLRANLSHCYRARACCSLRTCTPVLLCKSVIYATRDSLLARTGNPTTFSFDALPDCAERRDSAAVVYNRQAFHARSAVKRAGSAKFRKRNDPRSTPLPDKDGLCPAVSPPSEATSHEASLATYGASRGTRPALSLARTTSTSLMTDQAPRDLEATRPRTRPDTFVLRVGGPSRAIPPPGHASKHAGFRCRIAGQEGESEVPDTTAVTRSDSTNSSAPNVPTTQGA